MRVAVIGGGLAGVECASALSRNGITVDLFEMKPHTDEVRTTLKTLRKKGYKLAVGSSSKNTRFILERTNLTDAFDDIADGNDIVNSKPDPEVFLKAASLINVAPENCAVVEDAEAGLEAATRGNMLPIAYASAIDCPLGKIALHKFSNLTELF